MCVCGLNLKRITAQTKRSHNVTSTKNYEKHNFKNSRTPILLDEIIKSATPARYALFPYVCIYRLLSVTYAGVGPSVPQHTSSQALNSNPPS